MQEFVHLHVHTQYSLLDGQTDIHKMVDKAVADGMRGIAVTDHGNMMGIKEFYNYCQKKNQKLAEEGKHFKPILGCEVYVAARKKEQKESGVDSTCYHLILLAKNATGYHNLVKLVSRAWTDGFYSHPRTDHDDIVKYHEGLICCSACLAGEVARKISAGDIAEAERIAEWYKGVFGEDYYLEMQLHKASVELANHETYEQQLVANRHIREIAAKLGIKTICTNDCHFLDEENADAHEILICLNTGRKPTDPKLMRYSKQEWLKTTQEMNQVFADDPVSLANTIEILDKVEEYSIDHAPIMPNFNIPEEFGTEEGYRQKFSEQDLFDEFTRNEHGEVVLPEDEAKKKISKLGGYDKLYRIKLEADYLKEITLIGAKKRYGDPVPQNVMEQLIFELHIMKTMGFPGYFLIVQDFISAARNELDVSVGPGRGSAAGSAVAYCLGITQIDPIKYDLLFERFLNPDRISLPDIDVDFDDDGRGRVLQWVTQKYGAEKVAHIITYGTMATKMSIKDVGRVLEVPLEISNKICKAIPDKLPSGNKINLTNVLSEIPEVKAAEASEDPRVRSTIKFAKMLEGNVRGTGVHACGTIICRDDITDWVPVSIATDKDTGERLLVTQYEGSVIEDTGLIKMDFLGLKTLSIIKEAVEYIKDSRGIDVDVDTIPIDDELTYKLYGEGATVGTFQFESAGMQKYLRELKPTTFEDLIAMNALYRPGPMEYIPAFIKRKHGIEPIVYDIPCMEQYLKDTYGITVYQEQVMLLSRLLANFTRGESDTLRKAMGKKQKDKLDHLKPKFIEGGKANGHNEKVLEKIWTDWEKFASYAFNKSHATCYSWVAYQTAYLKAHYPAEYMAGVLSRNLSEITEITKLLDECTNMGIQVLGPDVNESNVKFSVNKDGNIRFGLTAIKGVGSNAVQAIVSEREKNGAFTDIFDFAQRVNLTACNRKNIECLATSGAFDCFKEVQRETFFAITEKSESFAEVLIRYGTKYQIDKSQAENSLFGMMGTEVEIKTPKIPSCQRWDPLTRLNKEKELVGIYLSSHPLDQYKLIMNHVCTTKLSELEDLTKLADQKVKFGGFVSSVRTGVTKTKGHPYGAVKIVDYTGSYEMFMVGDLWAKFQGYMVENNFLFVQGECKERFKGSKMYEIIPQEVRYLSDVSETAIQTITISLDLQNIDESLVAELEEKLNTQGKVKLFFLVRDLTDKPYQVKLSSNKSIALTESLLNFIDSGNSGITYTIND